MNMRAAPPCCVKLACVAPRSIVSSSGSILVCWESLSSSPPLPSPVSTPPSSSVVDLWVPSNISLSVNAEEEEEEEDDDDDDPI